MKPVPILLSLVISATAQGPAGEVVGSVRGRKLVTKTVKRDGASSIVGTKRRKTLNKKVVLIDNTSSTSSLNLKENAHSAARQELTRRNVIGDKLHKALIKKDGRVVKEETQTKKSRHVDEKMEDRELAKDELDSAKKGKLDRKLMKAKSFKEGYVGTHEDSHYDWDDDDMPVGGSGQGGFFGKANKSPYGSGSGGSGSGGSGKSGKYGGGSGGSGKSGKYSGMGDVCGDYHYVEVTNLSFQQSFSEIFIMTAEHAVTEWLPIFVVGNHSNNALASLAEDADASEMQERYMYRKGVEQVKIFGDFDQYDLGQKFLQGGATAKFKISTSGYGHRLSIAVGLPFTNDGAVVLQGVDIYDGAEYLVPPIDAGVEANIQTCWSVAAAQEDFPPQSICSEDEDSDENFNDLPGEGFVHMHRGIHDLDDKADLEDLLLFPECADVLSESELKGTERFARYFYKNGFDDDFLLCDNYNPGSSICGNPRDDEAFLGIINDYDDFADNRYVDLALQSDDFDDFCKLISDANKDLEALFNTLEPWLFDWRNEIMHVKIHCGYDELVRDSWNELEVESSSDDDDDEDDDDNDDEDDNDEDKEKRLGGASSFESLSFSGIKPHNVSSVEPLNSTKPVVASMEGGP
jgi:hypothetical protein